MAESRTVGEDSSQKSYERRANTRRERLAKAFPQAADALLILKYFGHVIEDDVTFLLMAGKETGLLDLAKSYQAAEDARLSK